MYKPNHEKILRKVEKPGRYTGGELHEIIKDPAKVDIRFAFAFPDTYEIGMSNLGMRILYGILNQLDYVWCERVFAPWEDMARQLEESGEDLYALESGDSLRKFDFLGFSLQYELCYSNVLYMMKLAGIPLLSAERGEEAPILFGGGPCAYNAEPVADFFDLIAVGEGEECVVEVVELYREHKRNGFVKENFLKAAAGIGGIYVPSLYHAEYGEDFKIKSFSTKYENIPKTVTKRVVTDLDKSYFPSTPILPFIETVHDRIMLEVFRGCPRGCRYCQAGTAFRPMREKSPETLNRQAKELFENTGYNEISLSALSISDYSGLAPLCDTLTSWTNDKMINISLPSMRIDAFSKELLDKISEVRSSTLTFAPEAGTQRMRDIINKNLTEEEILFAVRTAFGSGKTSVKLYFMIGLPGETDEDIIGIADLAQKVVDEYYKSPAKPKGKSVRVTISVASFIPKPFTPFQWEPQNSYDELMRKQKLLSASIRTKKIVYNYHDARISRLEAVFARGDRRLSKVLLEASKLGICFDGWDEKFRYDLWERAFQNAGINMESYACREFNYNDILPWDYIDAGVEKDFLISESELSKTGKTTPECREKCSGCGASRLGGEGSCCP